MKGGFVHDHVLVYLLAEAFERVCATVDLQTSAPYGGHRGFSDVVARLHDGRLIVCEIELTARRLANDIEKTAALGSDELWVIVPNRHVREANLRRLRQLQRPSFHVSVLTLPQALERISDCFRTSLSEQENGKTEK